MLTVFNVGQGDSFLLEVHRGCRFFSTPILIDTGPLGAKVADRLPSTELHVLITHSHKDHLAGLPRVLRKKTVHQMFIPYYLPEVSKISKYLHKYTGHTIKSLNWKRLKSLDVQLVGEGDSLCSHISILNPPKDVLNYRFSYPNEERSIEHALDILNQRGLELPADEIIEYTSPVGRANLPDISQEYFIQARQFVHQFFISLSHVIEHIETESLPYYIAQEVDLTSNEASIVFKYRDPNNAWLFTGDADEKVFGRLISQKRDITALYLKVPHHGSRGNLSGRTLDLIRPKYAFLSHGNRKFGMSKDPHPHHEIIHLLDQRRIQTFYTNPVIKRKRLIKHGTTGKILKGLVMFK